MSAGERNGQAVLTARQVEAIRRRWARGERVNALARLFGVSHGQVSKIVHGRKWAHLTGPVTREEGRADGP